MKNRDAILGKISNIRNCLVSIKNVTGLDPGSLTDQIKQDVFVLNLERATQACIDMANLLIAQNGYELPRSYKHAFAILEANAIIDSVVSEKMKRMAGFRNIAIHDYVKLDLKILQAILTSNLTDIEDYCEAIHKAIQPAP
jgi:uncharacterized protein YutE (UPF0331/DUF86 family)